MTEEPCNREGYGSSGVHAPVGPFRCTDKYVYGTCYNCKRPVRAGSGQSWSMIGAYVVVEWP